MENKKNAIVFAGGGSKGAYQLGVWKALNELGESFSIATGTSIGSINAAFYVQNDYAAAEKMWGEITAGDIMTNGINLEVSFESIVSQKDNLVPFFKNYLNAKSVDNTPFLNMILKYFSPDKFFSSDIDFALMTAMFEGHMVGHIPTDVIPVEITKEDMRLAGENAWKWIGASCACFPVFPPMEIEGKSYVDGGFYDNIPVASAIKLGAEKIVVVDLNTDNCHEGYIRHPAVTYIKPSKDLGAFLNFISFTHSQLVVTDSDGNSTILYDVSTYQLIKTLSIVTAIVAAVGYLIIYMIRNIKADEKSKGENSKNVTN